MGTLHVWSDGAWTTIDAVGDPECEADGELFWVWTDGESVRLNFEEWDGQADLALPSLLAEFPGMRALPINGDGPWDPRAETLGEVCSSLPPPIRIRDVEIWYHGTTAGRLDGMLAEGIRSDLPAGLRVWRNADIPGGVVYLTCDRVVAAEYARHAARGSGEPLTIEIDASALDPDLFEVDRDFPLLSVAASREHASLAGLDDADASLTLTGKVGYRGTVPAAALTAVIDRDGRRELDRVDAPSPGC